MKINQSNQSFSRAITLSALFAVGAVGVVGLKGYAGQPPTKTPPVSPPAQAIAMQNSFEQVAETLRPSVVFITSSKKMQSPASFLSPDGDDAPNLEIPIDPQERVFPVPPQGRNFQGAPMFPRKANASGSGVIIREDGYILTNDHVVEGADKVTVRLQDGREFIGEVKRDFRSDLALIKINASGLPKAELADSDKLHMGQWAIAFGSPFGLKDTMTVGIVSSLHRQEIIGGRNYSSLIQTDASINPGNSGGPLVDIYGRVIGINVAIESPSGTSAGIGFTIPSNTAKYISDQLINKGSVTRGYLGLVPAEPTYSEKKSAGVDRGAIVKRVEDGTPAENAGVQVGDVILKFNDKLVEDDANLRDLISRTAPKQQVEIVVKRDGKEERLRVIVGEAPDAQRLVVSASRVPKTPTKVKLGVAVAGVNDPKVKEMFDFQGKVKEGVVIASILPSSPAAEAGLQPGDVITKLGSETIRDAAQFGEIAAGLKNGSTVTAKVRRLNPKDGTMSTLQIDINLE